MSIKVLIVDDEVLVRKGLTATVAWEKYGMEVVADAPNGQKGWEAFVEHEPDLVITDIVMPVMNGLELTKKVKDHSPQTKILLLSCHQDFAYAQQGIRLGVCGYLLKTEFHDDELERYLERFHSEIHAEKAASPNGNGLAETEKRNASFCAWLFGFSQQFEADLKELLKKEWQWMNRPFHVCLLRSAGDNFALEEIKRELGTECEAISFREDRCYLFTANKSKLDTLLVEWRIRRPDLRWETTGPISGEEAWLRGVRGLHKQAELAEAYDLQGDSWQETIGKAVHYIIEHLSSPLAGSEVARHVGLSRSHFSTLFKKTVGENFGAYVDGKRVKLACELLKTTPMNIQEISEKVGMPDAKYFSKWFKKCVGTTPSHYRAEQKEKLGRTEMHP